MTPDQLARAACRGVDTAVFFPPPTRGRTDEYAYAAARAICARCPADVREACLAAALAEDYGHGFRGGTSPAERGRRGDGHATRRRVCVECGAEFRAAGKASYCSGACRTAARPERLYGGDAA